MDRDNVKLQAERVTGVSNVAYDLLVVLANQLQGTAAIETYKLDADAAGDTDARAVFERIEQRQRDGIEELRSLVVSRLQ